MKKHEECVKFILFCCRRTAQKRGDPLSAAVQYIAFKIIITYVLDIFTLNSCYLQ